MLFNKNIHNLQDRLFSTVIFISYLLYIAIVLGISANAPEYLDQLQYYIKLYILNLLYQLYQLYRILIPHVKFWLRFGLSQL